MKRGRASDRKETERDSEGDKTVRRIERGAEIDKARETHEDKVRRRTRTRDICRPTEKRIIIRRTDGRKELERGVKSSGYRRKRRLWRDSEG